MYYKGPVHSDLEKYMTGKKLYKKIVAAEKKEVRCSILKNKINRLPDYIFQRIQLMDQYCKEYEPCDKFKFWCFNIVDILTDKLSIETYFNIDYMIFCDEFDLRDISLLITMTKIGFDYSQFKKDDELQYEII